MTKVWTAYFFRWNKLMVWRNRIFKQSACREIKFNSCFNSDFGILKKNIPGVFKQSVNQIVENTSTVFYDIGAVVFQLFKFEICQKYIFQGIIYLLVWNLRWDHHKCVQKYNLKNVVNCIFGRISKLKGLNTTAPITEKTEEAIVKVKVIYNYTIKRFCQNIDILLKHRKQTRWYCVGLICCGCTALHQENALLHLW